MKKMVSVVILILLIGISTLAFNIQTAKCSEPPATEWNKAYGGAGQDMADEVVQTSDGGYAMAGYTGSSGAGLFDFWLIKTDASGNKEWDETYGGANKDEARYVILTEDEGYALAGNTESYGSGNSDFWLVKTDSNGNLEWNEAYGGTDTDDGHCITQTSEGGYALTGSTRSFGAGGCDLWFVKTDAFGNLEWAIPYGGTNNDAGYSVVETDDGYVLAGYTASVGSGDRDFWLIATDDTGSLQWSKTYGGPNDDTAYYMVKTGDGGYALAGYITSDAGWRDFWLVKTDFFGTMEWNKTYGSATVHDWASSVEQTEDGGFVIVGMTGGTPGVPGGKDAWVIKTDSAGNVEWNQTYGDAGDDMALSVIQTDDRGFCVAGQTGSWPYGDAWLVKLAPHKIIWASTTSLPAKRSGQPSVAYSERIYVLGGHQVDTVYYCNVNPDGTIDSWHSTTSLPDDRWQTVALAYGGYVYFLGGESSPGPTWQSEVWYAEIQADGSLSAWLSTTSLPRGMGGHGGFEWNGRLYVLGGWTGSSFRRETYFAEVQPDGSLGSWTSTSSLPAARGHGIAAVAHNGYAYALGGQGPDLADKADVWCAQINSDGTLDPWASTTSMPVGLESHAVAVVEDEIYVIGGYTHPPWTERSEVYRAHINPDGTLGAWTRDTDIALPIGIEPRGHLYNQAPVVNNRIYVIGGTDETGGATDTVYYTQTVGPPIEEKPIAVLSASPTTVDITEDVAFDASSSYDPDGTVEYYWFDYGDDSDSGWVSSSTITHGYTESGIYYAKAKVKDNDGLESEWSEPIKITADYIQLANQYFPYLIFDEEEEYYPAGFFYDDTDVSNNPSQYDETWSLTAYVHTVEFNSAVYPGKEFLAIEYWLYYARDDGTTLIEIEDSEIVLGQHDHDWESVFVFLEKTDDQYGPAYVAYFHHTNFEFPPLEAVEDCWSLNRWSLFGLRSFEVKDETHPIVHVCRDSHASDEKTYFGYGLCWIKISKKTVYDFQLPVFEPCDGGLEVEYNDFQIVYVDEPDTSWPDQFGDIEAPWVRDRWDYPDGILAPYKVIKNSFSMLSLNELGRKLHLHVFDNLSRHVGFNNEISEIEVEIPGAHMVDFGNTSFITLPVNITDFEVIVDGQYAHEPVETYELVISTVREDKPVEEIMIEGNIEQGGIQHYTVSVSETGEMEVISWEYVFEDAKRGTMLKISTDDKYFQFVAPDKEFPIKEVCKMIVREHSIFIWHKDDEIKLVTIAIDTRIDFCFAYAKDMQTGDRYLLIDKLGIE